MITPLSKVIEINFNLTETNKALLTKAATNKQFNTADTDAWFEFGFTDANIQSGTYNLTLINLKDESKFEHEGIAFNSNPFYYKLDSGADMQTNEIKHAGTWIGQLVVTLDNGKTGTQKFVFDIENHILDGTVASVTMLEGYSGLMAQIENAKELLDQYNIDYAALLADLEATYNSRLFSVERQLADKAEQSDLQSESTNRATGDGNLQTQINTIVLQGTSGDSSAEIAQSKGSNSGTPFPTLKSRLDSIEKATIKYVDKKHAFKWVRGTVDGTTGLTTANTTRLCTDTFCYAGKELTLNVSDGAAYKFGVRTFPNYPSVSGSIDPGWIYAEKIIPAGTWFKVNLSKFDGSVLTDTSAFGELLDAFTATDADSFFVVVKNAENIPDLVLLREALLPYADRKVAWDWIMAHLSGTGVLNEAVKYRITTKNIEISDTVYNFEFDITNYKYWIQLYDVNNAVTETKEFSAFTGTTSYVMVKDQKFRVTIGRAVNDTGEVFTTAKNDLYESLIIKADGDLQTVSNLAINAAEQNLNLPTAAIRANAHRGLATFFPENTMAAYKGTFDRGFRILETDIKFTSDNVPVILHDLTINRTGRNSDGTAISSTINIADITYTQALDYDFGVFFGAAFAGEKIPKLEELLLFAKKNNCHLQLDGFESSKIQAIYDVVVKYGMRDYVCWSSFVKADLQEILALHSKSYVIYLTSNAFTTALIDDIATLKTDWNTVSFSPYITQLTDNTIINYAHTKNVKVEPYVVDTKVKLIELVNAGVDGIITNSLNVAELLKN